MVLLKFILKYYFTICWCLPITQPQVEDPSQPNDEGITALHNAVCAGHTEIVKFLVQFGVNVNAADSDGWWVHCWLYYCIWASNKSKLLFLIYILYFSTIKFGQLWIVLQNELAKNWNNQNLANVFWILSLLSLFLSHPLSNTGHLFTVLHPATMCKCASSWWSLAQQCLLWLTATCKQQLINVKRWRRAIPSAHSSSMVSESYIIILAFAMLCMIFS